jgi:uncharacterized RDD family membrane protein YckC
VAALLDGAFGVAVVAFSVSDGEGRRPWLGAMLTARGGLGVWCGVGWLYTLIFERTACLQATPGKVVMNVRVESVGGDAVRADMAAIRNALRLVDLQPFLSYLVGAAFAVRSPLRQRVGDRMAGTFVARHRFAPGERMACLIALTGPVVALVLAERKRLGAR